MASTFGILETARSGLSVSMEELKITGHNISNANTVGYTRQRLITSAKDSASSVNMIRPVTENTIGRGVEVISIQQIRSEYLDNQYRDLNSSYRYSDSNAQSLTYLEGLFNSETDDGEGLTGAIEDFFSALDTFTEDTTSEENRITVQKSALSMTQSFNLVNQEMESLWADQNDSISTVTQEINSAAKKLTQLNESIASYERSGDIANDLRDERNLLLDELSGYVDITYNNNETNSSMVDVQISGISLVEGTTANTIQVNSAASHSDEIDALTSDIASTNDAISSALASDPSADTSALQTQLSGYLTDLGNYITVSSSADSNGITDVTYNGVSLVSGSTSTSIGDAVENNLTAWISFNKNNLSLNGSELSIEAGTVESGELYAHMEMVSSTDSENPGIPYYMDQLNDLAREIAQNINDIHLTGYSYDADDSIAATTSKNGIYFFNVDTETDVDGNVTEEYYDRVTAGNFSISGDISNSVWNIAGSSVQVYSDGTTMDTGNSEIASALYKDLTDSGYYSSLNGIVGHLSIALNTGKSMLDTKESLLNSIDSQRTSVSGVSVDEETTNLIVYQQSYNACARVITAIDEMLDTMISNMGTVGR
ncbi:hypothetical protein SDC9_55454 [bioreactor metagenome]|uniref:Flagellar hook-associated protein 1 n=1 Tax=bioreactor metagenome TaxID=1076179 RepID=A0A644X008_9ZZZZ